MRLVDVEYGLEVLCFPLNVAKMSDTQEFQSRLADLIRRIYSGSAELASVDRLSGGASQETWLLKLKGSGAPGSLILRRAPETARSATSTNAIGLPNEAKVIRAAAQVDVPVPEVVHVLTEEDRLGEGFLMGRVMGETIARRILRDDEFERARGALPVQCGRALAGIHSLATDCADALSVSTGLDQIANYEEVYQSTGIARPVFDLAIVWLRDNAPKPLTPVLVHGDFRLGNIMVDHEGLAAVLDWELAHIGDPREDIAWMCVNSWRFGQSDKRLGGFGDVEDLLAAYEEAGGVSLTAKDIDWWEILGSMKWGIMCMMMYESFRSGSDESVERAAIGRRVSETEIDLVNLLEKQRDV